MEIGHSAKAFDLALCAEGPSSAIETGQLGLADGHQRFDFQREGCIRRLARSPGFPGETHDIGFRRQLGTIELQ